MAQRPSRGRTECTRNRGFAAILSVVLVSGIALIASVAVAANFILQSREITDRIFAIQARSSANSCAYIALLRLKLNNSYNGNEDFIYNAFNIDMYFTWLFAPGSELVLTWKNAIYTTEGLPSDGYFREFASTLEAPASNLISLKILYYLDSQYFRKRK